MQVKFRGKRKGGNEWLIGDLNHIQGGVFIFPRQGKDAKIINSPDWFEVEPSSIGMFTGLTDKNGKEIFGAVGEKGGDILDFGYPTTSKYEPDDDTFRLPIKVVIDFHGGAFWVTGEGYTDCNWHFYDREDREIIGNAFDNPEFLEK